MLEEEGEISESERLRLKAILYTLTVINLCSLIMKSFCTLAWLEVES